MILNIDISKLTAYNVEAKPFYLFWVFYGSSNKCYFT